MFLLVALAFFLAWLTGFVVLHLAGGWIHALLICAVMALVIEVMGSGGRHTLLPDDDADAPNRFGRPLQRPRERRAG